MLREPVDYVFYLEIAKDEVVVASFDSAEGTGRKEGASSPSAIWDFS